MQVEIVDLEDTYFGKSEKVNLPKNRKFSENIFDYIFLAILTRITLKISTNMIYAFINDRGTLLAFINAKFQCFYLKFLQVIYESNICANFPLKAL